MTEHRRTDHEAGLIAAAAAGGLTPADTREYDALVAADPSAAAETAELRATLDRVGVLPGWDEVSPDAALAARVLRIPDSAPAADAPRRRRRWLPAVAAAAALLVLGGVAGSWVDDLGSGPPKGPPGTLGAIEPIDFRGEPSEVEIEAALVAHTWGTETVLDMDGWEPGESYRLVLVGDDGDVEESGTFLGSEVAIDCRMNGALLREDVDAVEIHDADGEVVASSDVPDVPASGAG